MTSPRLPVLPEGASIGSFDAEHPPSRARVEECVHCGFCLPSCPTYVLWGEEMDSPRGRIHLVKLALDGEAELNAELREHFDRCLGCMGCLTSCPSGVQYDVILEATRAQLERKVPRPLLDRAFRNLLLAIFPERRRLRGAAVLVWLTQVLGLRFIGRTFGRALPPRLRALEALSPRVRLRAALRGLPPPPDVDRPRARVAMLEGCVQSVFFSEVNADTVRLLSAEGIEVVPVPDQGCCGALELHAGEAARARARAQALIERFETVEVDHVVVNAAGCGSALKTVDRLFPEGDPFRPRAEAFRARVTDPLELLEHLGPRATYRPLEKRLAYHDACHLAHAQGISTAPRTVLGRIPGLEVVEIPSGEVCCGSAGIYNLLYPEPADELGRRKAENVRAVKPAILAAGNPGCLLQIRRHLGEGIRSVHPIQLLCEQLEVG